MASGRKPNEHEDYCEEQVSEPPWYFHTHRCTRKAKETVAGKRYCTQHAKIKRRRLAAK